MGNRRPETETGLGLDEKSLKAAHLEVRVKKLRRLAEAVNRKGESEEVINTAVETLLSEIDIIPEETRFEVEYIESLIGGEN